MTENQDVVAPALDTTRERSSSTTKADRGVPSFSASVLTHLKRIHASLSPATLDAKSDFRKGIQNDGDEEIGESTEDASQPDPLTSLPSFLAYMTSPIAKAHRHAEPLDLSAPISNYYISSSHNTYLTGNQLYGDASITSYTNVLRRGCRCLEIDVWDGDSRALTPSESSLSSGDEEPMSTKRTSQKGIKGHSTIKSVSAKFNQIMKRTLSRASQALTYA